MKYMTDITENKHFVYFGAPFPLLMTDLHFANETKHVMAIHISTELPINKIINNYYKTL